MALPDTDRFRRPTLQALSGGAPTTTKPVHDRVQQTLQIADDDRAYVPPTNNTSTFTNRVAWAFVDLQRRGLIEKTRADPNTYRITEIGQRALADGLDLSAISPGATRPLDLLQSVPSSDEPDTLLFGTRAFDTDRPPKQSDFRWLELNQEATNQLLEKARQGHHQILVDLAQWLAAHAWTAIGEIPGSIDLWATSPGSRRWLFEAKTIRDGNQLSQTRGALAQLLEYRVTYGADEDGLCIALDHSLPSERSDLLDRLGVAVIRVGDLAVECLNDVAEEITE